MERQNEELEIDLLGLFYYLKKKIVIIMAVCVLCTSLGFLVSKVFIAPTYTASTRVYVLNRSSENAVNYNDFTLSNYVINDYKALITGRNVTKEVIRRLKLDTTDEALASQIKVTADANTRLLQINVVDTDPQRAADIANIVREVAAEQIKDIMAVDAVNTIYEAEVPEEKSGPSNTRNALIAGILGLVAIVGVYAVIYILDDAIRTEEDVERYLGLSTMGVIPMSSELGAAGNVNRSAKKSPKKRPAVPNMLKQNKK